MVGVKVFVLSVLCSAVGPLAVRGDRIGRRGLERGVGKPNSSSRLDSDQDPTTLTTILGGAQSTLFGACVAQSNTAIVRMLQLNFESGEQYTRYVPSDPQLAMSDPSWVAVTDVPINSFLECASYAEGNDAMMFQYDVDNCSVSSLRLSTSFPKCGVRTTDAIFVRTSCAEPVLSEVTITPEVGALNVSWTSLDNCSLAAKYRVSWDGVGVNNSYETNDGNEKSHVIDGLANCGIDLSVNVIALDSNGAPYGEGVTQQVSSTPEPPVVSNVVVTATAVVTFDVTWNLIDTCGITDSQKLYASWSFFNISAATENGTATSSHIILQGCDDLEVTVMAISDDGMVLNSGSSDPTVPLFNLTCDASFTAKCSGCMLQDTSFVSKTTAVSYCSSQNSEAKLLAVSSEDEYTALRTYLNLNYAEPLRYWADIDLLANGSWVWGTGYVQQEPSATEWYSDEPNSQGATCAYIRGRDSFMLGDDKCTKSSSIAAMCFYNT